MSANAAKELGPAGPLLDGIGVAALSRHAVQAEFTDPVGTRALHAVEEWCRAIDTEGSYRLRTEKFPFGDVIEHFRSVGRGAAHPALIAKLRVLHASVQSEAPPEGCRDELSDAAHRLDATPALFRVLTTMPREAFAVIRENTYGRSAVQSTSYRRVELLSAPRDPGSFSPQAPFLALEGETLQEVFERQLPELPPKTVTRLEESMRRLDAGWHMSKRTHWGIALKIIGSAPGTGGTSGADYLQRTAEVSLFPNLIFSVRHRMVHRT
ncbi:hypothetical protein [Streptomyces sp. NPDC056358]|uniref:hypothetical protein n=1 Tax=Streptomyces sp. NPDC056358 TaxID=3345794 RepID=UPI0035E0BFF9